MIKAGIVGMGVIGQHIAKAIDNGIPGVTLAGVSVRTATTAGGFAAYSLDDLIRKADLIVEAATQAALLDFGPAVLTAGKHLMVLSVGGLVGVLDEWARLAERHGCRILVPSGAIAGLDGMKGAREGAITAVTMETRKPPRGLAGAPWIEEQRIDLDAITGETLHLRGSGRARGQGLPRQRERGGRAVARGHRPRAHAHQDLRRAGPGAEPAPDHHRGEFGRLRIEIENVPSDNPRTGKLSYLSAIAMLRELGTPVRVGS